MKKLHLLLICTLVMFSVSAQKIYFVYIQAEPDQPFYVKMNQKTYWSSTSGYIILPRLVDSSYALSVGFPENKYPEQNFLVSVNKKDHGYLLKQFEKGWGLYDLQTLSLLMASSNTPENSTSNTNPVTPFTEILANATDDQSLKQKPNRPKQEEVKTETVSEPVIEKSIDTAVVVIPEPVNKDNEETLKKSKKKKQKDNETVITEKPVTEPVNDNKDVVTENKPAVKTQTVEEKPVAVIEKPVEKYKATEVKKYAEMASTEGVGLVYIDNYSNGSRDTIRLIIPNPNPVVTQLKEPPKEEKKFLEISSEPKANEEKVADNVRVEEKPLSKKEKKAKKEEEKATEEPVITKETRPVVSEPVKSTEEISTKNTSPGFSNNCGDLASEDDFVRLRKKMAGEKEDKMSAEAKKIFKSKCFTTSQIRTLGRLFETDEERYNFFDAAYKHVSNPEAFSSLQTEFQDSYYANRFRAMLR